MNFLILPFAFLLSLPYRVGLFLDRACRTRHQARLGKPVVSVGNLTIGGTGKTPVVIRLAKDLQSLGKKPAVLSRGYRGVLKKAGPDVMIMGPNEGADVSDEAALMATKLPAVPLGIGANRSQAAEKLLARYSPDLFILEDGFQHWPVHRDFDIVCVDATDPWGGGALLPLGRLREPLTSLRRADAIILTRADLVTKTALIEIEKRITSTGTNAPILRAEFTTALWNATDEAYGTPGELYGKPVIALSALGRPHGFETMLDRLGAYVTPLRFRDHHAYSESDLDRVTAIQTKKGAAVVTTEKDWVKLKKTRWGRRENRPAAVYVLKVEIKFLDGDEARWRDLLKAQFHENSTSH